MDLMVVGPGRMGLALAWALTLEDVVQDVVVCGRTPDMPDHPIFSQNRARYVFGLERPSDRTAAVILAIPEEGLPELATSLASLGPAPQGCSAFHVRAGLSTDVLAPLHEAGYSLGSFFPLQPIAHPLTSAERLVGSWFAVTGARDAMHVARTLASGLSGHVLEVPHTWKPVADAAFTLTSGAVPAVLASMTRLLSEIGVHPDDGLPALVSLVRGVLDNVEELGLDRGLTGPFVEGDLETASLHLRALEGDDRRRYAWLGREVARISQEEGGGQDLAALLARFDSELKDS